jgi:hypothetical protein
MVSLENVPLSAVMICSGSTPLSDTQPIIDTEILSESVATSEIFRRASSVYTFRAMMGDSVPLDPATQEDIDEGFRLLSKVPEYSFPARTANFSAQGPGSMLGWAITVMGSELPASMEEEREYLRCRWSGIHGLGMKHSLRAAELLEVRYRRPSALIGTGGLATKGSSKRYWWPVISKVFPSSRIQLTYRFQDVSRDLGWELVLI